MQGQVAEFTLTVYTNARPGTDIITFTGAPDFTIDQTTAIAAIVGEKLSQCDRCVVHNFEMGSGTPGVPNQIELWASGSGDWHNMVHEMFTETLSDWLGHNSFVVTLVINPQRAA